MRARICRALAVLVGHGACGRECELAAAPRFSLAPPAICRLTASRHLYCLKREASVLAHCLWASVLAHCLPLESSRLIARCRRGVACLTPMACSGRLGLLGPHHTLNTITPSDRAPTLPTPRHDSETARHGQKLELGFECCLHSFVFRRIPAIIRVYYYFQKPQEKKRLVKKAGRPRKPLCAHLVQLKLSCSTHRVDITHDITLPRHHTQTHT